MTVFDYAVLVIISLSLLISILRGGVRELLSFVGWVIAFYAAKTYANQLAPLLPQDIPTDQLRMMAAFLILFFSTLLISSLLSIALSGIVKKIGIGWLNRFLGGVFGLMRGFLIVSVFVMLGGMTNLPKDERWENAMFSSPLEALVTAMLPWLPKSLSQYVRFEESKSF